MTRTNTFRVTFSANIDEAEGYLTEKSEKKLSSIPFEYGGLWGLEVIREWQEELKRAEEYSMAAFHGDLDRSDGILEVNTKELTKKLWEIGCTTDSFMATAYDIQGDMDEHIGIETYQASPEFHEWMHKTARSEAKTIAEKYRRDGVDYLCGFWPKREELVRFYVLQELAGQKWTPDTVPPNRDDDDMAEFRE